MMIFSRRSGWRCHSHTMARSHPDYASQLATAFQAFPDDWDTLRREGLAFFRYSLTEKALNQPKGTAFPSSLDALIAAGYVRFDPIIYEDFLPVSAAGIFQSNLGTEAQHHYSGRASQDAFEQALGCPVQGRNQPLCTGRTTIPVTDR